MRLRSTESAVSEIERNRAQLSRLLRVANRVRVTWRSIQEPGTRDLENHPEHPACLEALQESTTPFTDAHALEIFTP